MKSLLTACLIFFLCATVRSQDTFSIVAVDSVTGEVGAAGASCVDLFAAGISDAGFLAELFPDSGAIATQASYLVGNQANARNRMRAGDSAAQIISWVVANDIQGNPNIRQYGVARLTGTGAQAAGHTGTSCINYKNHISGANYNIQGNILLGQSVLDSMESRFNNEQGNLACKLMAALQGAKVPGADTRCLLNGTSSLFAFLKVMQPNEVFGSPSLSLGVKFAANTGMEPIDSLAVLFDMLQLNCTTTGIPVQDDLMKVKLVPNPVTNMAALHLDHSGNEHITVTLLDITGRESTILYEGHPASGLQVDLSDYPSGIYFLRISGKETVYLKCMKM